MPSLGVRSRRSVRRVGGFAALVALTASTVNAPSAGAGAQKYATYAITPDAAALKREGLRVTWPVGFSPAPTLAGTTLTLGVRPSGGARRRARTAMVVLRRETANGQSSVVKRVRLRRGDVRLRLEQTGRYRLVMTAGSYRLASLIDVVPETTPAKVAVAETGGSWLGTFTRLHVRNIGPWPIPYAPATAWSLARNDANAWVTLPTVVVDQPAKTPSAVLEPGQGIEATITTTEPMIPAFYQSRWQPTSLPGPGNPTTPPAPFTDEFRIIVDTCRDHDDQTACKIPT